MHSAKGRALLCLIYWLYVPLVLTAGGAAATLGWSRLSLPFQLDYGEGPIMWQVMNVLDHHRAYAALGNGPQVIWNYPPLYLIFVRVLLPISPNLLWTGRFVSWLSALGIAALLCVIIYVSLPRRFGRAGRIAAAATGLLYPCAEPVLHWVPFMRVDFLGLLATYLGLFFFLSSRAKPWKVYLAFFFFFLAVWTKQTYLSAPFVCLLITFFLAPRRALRLCVTYGVTGVLLFWIGMRWTSGGLALHLIPYNVHAFSLRRAIAGVGENLVEIRLFLVLCGALLLTTFIRASEGRAKSRRARWAARLRHSPLFLTLLVETLHLAIAFLFSYSYGKIGSNKNYFLEWTAAVVVLCGCAVGLLFREMHRAPRPTLTTLASSLFVLFLPVQMLGRTIHTMHPPKEIQMEQDKEREAYEQLMPLIKNTKGPVLSDDMVLLTLAGKEIVYEPATMKFIADVGRWDHAGFEGRVESQEFALIIMTSAKFWHSDVTKAILKGYERDLVIGKYELYKPRAAFTTMH